MRRAAPRRRPAHLRFQILDLDVEISTPSTDIAETVRMLDQTAHHAFPTTRAVEYEIVPSERGFDVTENGVSLGTQPYPIDVLMQLESRIYAQAFATTPGMALLAACVRPDGRRLLLLGDNDARVTALLLALLSDGAEVEGDWSVVVHGDDVTTVARPLRVQQDALAALPEAAELVGGGPRVQDALGRIIWSFDPASAGFDWEIRRAPVDGIVVVESNPGGHSRLEPRPRYETAQDVVVALGRPPSAAEVAAACRLVDASACSRLRLGGLEEASALLRGG